MQKPEPKPSAQTRILAAERQSRNSIGRRLGFFERGAHRLGEGRGVHLDGVP